MIKAKVTKQFSGVRDGEVYPTILRPGVQISGELARVAIQEGLAERLETGQPDRTKGAEDQGNALRASGAASQPARASRKSKSKRSEKPA